MAQYLKNLPVGALVKLGKHQVNSETAQPIIWIVADKSPANHSGYPSDSVTLITQKIIDLRAYDGYEDRKDGVGVENNPDYATSAINQWLNSSAKSSWFVKRNSRDNPPNDENTTGTTGYSHRPGFLYNFTGAERLALLHTTLTFPTESSFTTIDSTVFLPSLREVLGVDIVNDKTTRLQYFSSNGVATCALTPQAYTNTLCTNKPTSVDSMWKYFTRNTSYSSVYGVSNTGGSSGINTSDGSTGIRPMVNISANTKISDITDSEGCYTLLSQTPPTISGTNSDIGIKSEGVTQAYTVNDADNDIVTVTEYVDDEFVRSYVATLGVENKMTLTSEVWLRLTNGTHTIKIVATDGFDEVTRTFTFTKSVSKLVVQRSTPILSDNEPRSIIISVVKVIPQEATIKVEVCRNGFDTSPYWEDITSKVLSGKIHEFDTYHTKTASDWGINVRVTIDRNGGAGACYIKEIGGNFE